MKKGIIFAIKIYKNEQNTLRSRLFVIGNFKFLW